MIIYLSLYVYIIILYVVFLILKKQNESHLLKIILILAAIIPMYLLCVLKSSSVGTDTNAYIEAYKNSNSNASFLGRDYGYRILSFAFSKVGLPFKVFSCFCYSIIYGGLFLYVYKKVPKYLEFILFFVSLGLFTFGLSALRQMMCMGMFFFAMAFFNSKNKWSYLIFYIFAFLGISIHIAGITFIVYPLLT